MMHLCILAVVREFYNIETSSNYLPASSAYADLGWIHKLISFTVHLARDHPRVKLFGICFGHQIISLALGGTCVNNEDKWEIGPTKIRLTDVGERIFGIKNELVSRMVPMLRADINYCRAQTIQEVHQDHVPCVPQGCHLLASTDISMNQGIVSVIGTDYSFAPTSFCLAESPSILTTPSLLQPISIRSTDGPNPSPLTITCMTQIHILTVQGHPEFTRPIISKLVDDVLLKQGLITDALKADIDERNKALGDRIAGDGDIIGRIFWKILGI